MYSSFRCSSNSRSTTLFLCRFSISCGGHKTVLLNRWNEVDDLIICPQGHFFESKQLTVLCWTFVFDSQRYGMRALQNVSFENDTIEYLARFLAQTSEPRARFRRIRSEWESWSRRFLFVLAYLSPYGTRSWLMDLCSHAILLLCLFETQLPIRIVLSQKWFNLQHNKSLLGFWVHYTDWKVRRVHYFPNKSPKYLLALVGSLPVALGCWMLQQSSFAAAHCTLFVSFITHHAFHSFTLLILAGFQASFIAL